MKRIFYPFMLVALCGLFSFYFSNAQTQFKLTTGELILITEYDGPYGNGTILKVDSTGLTKLYDVEDYCSVPGAIGKDGYLYMFSCMGGSITRFKLDGTDEESLTFKGNRLDLPVHIAGLISTNSGIFGSSRESGQNHGWIFKVNYGNDYFENIYDFTGNGEKPHANLLAGRNGMIYGTAWKGGVNNYGVIFKINQDGTQYTSLFDFDNINGRLPEGTLVQDADGFLYGTAGGGKRGKGVLYKIGEDGQNFQKLLDFADLSIQYPVYDLALDSDGYLYSNTNLFKIKTDGSNLSGLTAPILHPVLADVIPDTYITNPQDQSGDLPINLVLQVKPLKGVTQYIIELSESADFTTALITFASTELKINVKNLNYGTRYYARVKTDISKYYHSEYGQVTSFVTGGKQSLSDVYVINPRDGLTNVHIHAFIKVKPFPGATNYAIELSENANFSGEVMLLNTDILSPPEASRTDLKYNTVYYARVKTEGSLGYGKTTSFTTRSVLGYSFISLPTEGANVSSDPLKITANIVEGAKRYTIQICEDQYFGSNGYYGSPVVEKTSEKDNQRTMFFNGLDYSSQYFARVKTDLSPDWGPVRSFTTTGKLIFILDPQNDATGLPITGLKITISPDQYAINYSVEISKDPSFEYSYIVFSGSSSQNTIRITGLKYGTRYYVRVKSNRFPYGDWFGYNTFTTMTDPALSISNTSSIVYPNPSSNTFTLIKGTEQITSMTLTDANGIVIYKNESVGDEPSTQFGENLGKGFYILKVTTASGTKVERLVKN